MNWDLVSNFAIAMLAIVNPIEKTPLWVAASKSDQRGFKWLLAALVILFLRFDPAVFSLVRPVAPDQTQYRSGKLQDRRRAHSS